MIEASAMVAVIVGMAEAVKRLGLPARFVPLLNIGLGVAATCAFGDAMLAENVFAGVVTGLTASGLYSGVKNVMQGLKE